MYPTRWSPPRCAKRPHHCGHVRYKVARLTTCDCHPTQKPYNKKKNLKSRFSRRKQTSHSPISNGHSSPLDVPPKILPFLFSSMERHRKPCLLC